MTCMCCGAAVQARPATVAPFVQQRCRVANETRTLVCPDCGFARCELRLTDAQMAALYAGYRGPAYTAEREACEPGYTAQYGALNHVRDYVDAVEGMIRRHAGGHIGTVLDVGGNDGANAPFLGLAVVDVLDVSDVPLAPGAHRVDIPGRVYDLAVLAHVLEHAPDPAGLLRDSADWARLVYVEVPIEPVPDAWHEHCNNFTPTALRALASRANLRTLEMDTRSTSLGTVLMAVLS